MTIAEVSRKYEISVDTLRYYERIGLIPPVNRTAGGIRNYTETDCNWVGFAKCMRGAGIQVEALIDYVALRGGAEKYLLRLLVRVARLLQMVRPLEAHNRIPRNGTVVIRCFIAAHVI